MGVTVTALAALRAVRASTAARATLLALALAGCGVAINASPGDSSAVFPHRDGFDADHGAAAVADPSRCLACHGEAVGDEVNGTRPIAPSCRSCHPAYPHRDGFDAGSAHGPVARQDRAVCSGCHGEDGAAPPAGVLDAACTACHSTYPHPAAFAAASAHGAAQRARGAPACIGCHGADGAAMPAGDCVPCHDYPHGTGWGSPLEHGAFARAEPSSCVGCHGASEPGRVPCARCHDLYPHPQGFRGDHAAIAQQRGDLACAACHDGDVIGPSLPVLCGGVCHGAGP